MRWAGQAERVRKKIKFVEGFGGKTWREETSWSPRKGRNYNVRNYLREI